MKIFSVVQLIVLLVIGVAAITTQTASSSTLSASSSSSSSISVAPTTVWVTVTTNGNVATVQTLYSQTFAPIFTSVDTNVPAGSVGMGTLSGSIGTMRSYTQSTMHNAGSAVYASSLGFLALLLNWIF